jgi:hypothetical protein
MGKIGPEGILAFASAAAALAAAAQAHLATASVPGARKVV